MRWPFALMLLAGCRDLLGIDDGKPKPDAAVDAVVALDAGSDAMHACGATYMPLSGQAHLYKRITASAAWATQRTACTLDGGYLVVPDDASELQAIATFAGSATLWIGVSDLATAGTYTNVLGQTETYLPWGAGQPSGGNKQCVLVPSNMQAYATDLCGNPQQAVCECAP